MWSCKHSSGKKYFYKNAYTYIKHRYIHVQNNIRTTEYLLNDKIMGDFKFFIFFVLHFLR